MTDPTDSAPLEHVPAWARARAEYLDALEAALGASPDARAAAEQAASVVEQLLEDPGVALPADFADGVMDQLAADGVTVEAPAPGMTRGMKWGLVAAAVNAFLLLGLGAMTVLSGPPRPPEAADLPPEIIELIERQRTLIGQQKEVSALQARINQGLQEQTGQLVIKHQKELLALTERHGRDLAVFKASVDELNKKHTDELAAVTSRAKTLTTQLKVRDSEISELRTLMGQMVDVGKLDARMASLKKDAHDDQVRADAQIAALMKEIRTAGGDPTSPPKELADVVPLGRLGPWDGADGRIVRIAAGKAFVDVGSDHGVFVNVRFDVYARGIGGVLRRTGQARVIKVDDRESVVALTSLDGARPAAEGHFLFNPLFRRKVAARPPLRVAFAGAVPATTPLRARIAAQLKRLGTTLQARVDEGTDLVLVERDYATAEGFLLARKLNTRVMSVAALHHYLDLAKPIDAAGPAITSESLRRDLASVRELIAMRDQELEGLRSALGGLGGKLRALTLMTKQRYEKQEQANATIARLERHLRHLQRNPTRRKVDDPDEALPIKRERKRQAILAPDGKLLHAELDDLTATIDRGKRHRLRPGVVFEVYRTRKGGKRTPRARVRVIQDKDGVKATQATVRILGIYHRAAGKTTYYPLKGAGAVGRLPRLVRRHFRTIDPLASSDSAVDLIASELYDAKRPLNFVILGQLRGRHTNEEVRKLLAERGERFTRRVTDDVDYAIAGAGHDKDDNYEAVRARGIPLLTQEKLYELLGD